jgi:hypothetical protein
LNALNTKKNVHLVISLYVFVVWLMVFNTTFNNISVISWSQVTDKLYHIMLYTDCIGSCKSNNHTITTTTAPLVISLYFSEHYHIAKSINVQDLFAMGGNIQSILCMICEKEVEFDWCTGLSVPMHDTNTWNRFAN